MIQGGKKFKGGEKDNERGRKLDTERRERD